MAVHQIAATAFARPANTTAYAANDLVADDTTGASVTPISFSVRETRKRGRIARVAIEKSSTTTTAATFTLLLFTAEPTVANGDNGALAITSDLTELIGTVQVDMSSGAIAGSAAGLIDWATPTDLWFELGQFDAADFTLYGLLRADDTYTPASGETFAVTIYVVNEDVAL